ncbi:hypothetical protein [Pleomorphomonas sp. PLEO]|uniref:hypothetical protein n=1 Tax=Pleomorphomonas sp. PLEO TaxID=3239306 RepID=UPI00351F71DF
MTIIEKAAPNRAAFLLPGPLPAKVVNHLPRQMNAGHPKAANAHFPGFIGKIRPARDDVS